MALIIVHAKATKLYRNGEAKNMVSQKNDKIQSGGQEMAFYYHTYKGWMSSQR